MNCGFHDAVIAPGVGFDPNNGLGRRVKDHRDARNNMQHASAAATVDAFYCAAAILDVAEVIQTLWPGADFSSRIACALRVVRLYASNAQADARELFEEKMRKQRWRGESSSTKTHELQIELGKRDFWKWALRYRESNISAILDEIGAA